MVGLGIFLLAAGAIVTFAVKTAVDTVDLSAVGVILMLAGGLALLIALVRGVGMTHRRTRAERIVSPDGRHVVEETSSGL